MGAQFLISVTSLVQYLLLCLIGIFAGIGMMRLLRLRPSADTNFLLAPVIAQAFWAVVIGIAGAYAIPLQYILPALWGLSGLLAVAGFVVTLLAIRQRAQAAEDRLGVADQVREQWPLALALLLPIIVLLPYFQYGLADYLGSVKPDGWSYVAYGQTLWEVPRCTEGGLSQLHQYGAHPCETRWVGSSTLTLLSIFYTPGDTQAPTGLFLAWSIFLLGVGCALFSRATKLQHYLLASYLVFTLVSGWIFNVLWANNYDNLLALHYAPTLAGVVLIMNARSWGWRITLGLLGAALIYTYPELAPVVLGITFVILLGSLWRQRSISVSWILSAIIGLVVGVVLIGPFLQLLQKFFVGQLNVGITTGSRAGEGSFPGLVDLAYLPAAFWGLGGEFMLTTWLPLRNTLGLLLSGLLLLGIWHLWQQKKIELAAAIGLMFAAAMVFIFGQNYSYGAFKLILMCWWAFCYAVILGLDRLLTWIPPARNTRSAALAFALVIGSTMPFNHYGSVDSLPVFTYFSQPDMRQFRAVQEIKPIVGDAPLLVSVNDWLANIWAVYFLRDTSFRLQTYRMYMASPHVVAYMDRAKQPPLEGARFLLTDRNMQPSAGNQGLRKVWEGGAYRLWSIESPLWTVSDSVENANGVEFLDNQPFFWLGDTPSIMSLTAGQSGIAVVNAEYMLGPSLPEKATRTLKLTINGNAEHRVVIEREMLISGGPFSFDLPVQEGKNTILMEILDKPSVETLPTGDPRVLMLGVKGLSITLDKKPLLVGTPSNPNGVEQVDGQPYLWLGDQPATIPVVARETGFLSFQAEFQPGPSLTNVPTRTLQVKLDDLERRYTIGSGAHRIDLPIRAGEHTVSLQVLEQPNVEALANGDPRTLMLGVKGLHLSLDTRPLIVGGINNPNGIESIDGNTLLWLGEEPATISVIVRTPGFVSLAAEFQPGPSLPDVPTRTLQIKTGTTERTITIVEGQNVVVLPLEVGEHTISLQVLDKAGVDTLPSGETRKLMLAVVNPELTLDTRPLIIGAINNPNSVEQLNGKPFFWLGRQPATIPVTARASGIVSLAADFMPGPSLPEVPTRTLLIGDGAEGGRTVTVGSGQNVINIPVQAGDNLISLQVLDTPTITQLPNGDSRDLLLGVGNLDLSLDTNPIIVGTPSNPNGIEQRNGQTFFWMGREAATLPVTLRSAGIVSLTAEFQVGPSLPDYLTRTLLISGGSIEQVVTVNEGRQQIAVPLPAGEHTLLLRLLDEPTVKTLPNGDPRTLLMKVTNLQATLLERPVQLIDIKNPNGLELLRGKVFFWTGQGDTVIRVLAAYEGQLRLEANCLLGASLPGVDTRRIQVATDHGYSQTETLGAGKQTITLPVPAGETVIRLTALDTPTVAALPNEETRPLLLGFEGLQLSLTP